MSLDYLSVSDAESLAGRRLDRRRKWFVWDGEVCFEGKFTLPCSGCSCGGEYPCACCQEKGAGCNECGYTGKRADSFPIPFWTLYVNHD